MPKFDYIIQNPPHNKNLHIQFFNKGLDILSDTGKMTIIEPAIWLMNLRQNSPNVNKKFYIQEITPCKSSIISYRTRHIIKIYISSSSTKD